MEQMIINVILGLMKTGNIPLAILVMVLSILVGLWYYGRKRKPADLHNHTVFSHMHEFLESVYISDKDTKKSKLMKRCVKCYIEHFSAWLDEFICGDSEWKQTMILDSYRKMLTDVEICWLNDGAPMFMIEKWRVFNKTSSDMMYRYIRYCSDSEFYTTDLDKKLLVLTISKVIFFASVADLDALIASFNGELEEYLDAN